MNLRGKLRRSVALPNHAWGLTEKVNWFRTADSVGGTPTDAVETTALPKKSLMIGAYLITD